MKSGFLVGERIYLRPLEAGDMPLVQEWANDPETRALTGEVLPMGAGAAEEFFQHVRSDKDRVWFAVVLKDGDRVIGEAGLLRMYHPWRATDLTLIIGNKSERGKGHGTAAILLLLDYAFGYLSFHRVSVGVVGFNEVALRFYEKVGFRREGIEREGYYHGHAYHDFVMMSILEDEFRALHPPQGLR